MSAGAYEVEIVAFDLVDQHPVRLDVAIAKVLPAAMQRMVLVGRWQRLALEQ
jgi:hypothetical protein